MKPLILNAGEVRALLEAGKCVVERAMKIPRQGHDQIKCPFGSPGGSRWVKETWGEAWTYGGEYPCVCFKATNDSLVGDKDYPVADVAAGKFGIADSRRGGSPPKNMKFRPSVHMPQWASRLTVTLTDQAAVKVGGVWMWRATAAKVEVKL